jgi:DNA-binding beta-propeller fold protein YncE
MKAWILVVTLLAATPACAQSFSAQQRDPAGPIHIPDAPQLPYHFGPRPVAPLGETFGNIGGVAILPGGDLLVYNRNADIMMVEYDPTGTTVKRAFNPNMAVNPHGLRVDRHGNIWATDSFLNLVFKMDTQGNVLKVFGTRGENGPWTEGKWNGMFNQPLDVAFDKDDNFYVVQGHGGSLPPADCTFCATYEIPSVSSVPHHAAYAKPAVIQGSDPRVLKFDKDGHFLASASLAHPDGKYPIVHTVIVSPRGEVWIGDRSSQKILIFDKDLSAHHDIQLENLTCGFFEDAQGQLWMTTGRNGMVFKMGWDGKVQGWFGKYGTDTNSDDIGEGHFLAVSPDQKTIWVGDSVLAHVVKFEHN